LIGLGDILQATETRCYAWALLSNHFHLLLRTGSVEIATVMRGKTRKSGERPFQSKTKGGLGCGEDPDACSGAESPLLTGCTGTQRKHVIDVEKIECVNYGGK
jgi:hypothetical protein